MTFLSNLKETAQKAKQKIKGTNHSDELEDMLDPDDEQQTMYGYDESGIEMMDDEDEEEPVTQLKKKTIIGIASGVAVLAIGGMAANTLFSQPKEDPALTQKSVMAAQEKKESDLPSSYADIQKYQEQEKKKASSQATRSGQSQQNQSAQSSSEGPSNYKAKYQQQNTPSAQAPARTSGESNSSRTREEQAALKAAEQAQKEEDAAMTSSIAFTLAKAITATAADAVSSVQAVDETSAAPLYLDGSDSTGFSYALQAGSVIQATLLTGVTSDMPGDVVAQVRQNIYDSETGMHLLIPQGAKLIGTSGQAGSRGNKRIGVTFSRIILPDGRNIDLPNQQAIDGTGLPGLVDKYTTHSGSIFKSAFMTALLGAAAQSATGNTSGDDNRSPGQEAVSGAVAQVMQAASQLFSRDANVNPTITISPGAEFSVFINKDLLIPEYDG